MVFNLSKKLIIILSLLIGVIFFQCLIGDDRTRLVIYNNRSNNISVYYKKEFYDREGIPEKVLDIKKGEMSGISDSGLAVPLSRIISYLIINDSNGIEIMNLRGSDLDNKVKFVSQDEAEIIYRLDVY